MEPGSTLLDTHRYLPQHFQVASFEVMEPLAPSFTGIGARSYGRDGTQHNGRKPAEGNS